MGPRDRRSREKEELKDKILDAARELFVAEGYERVTMRKIAERIEYSPTAIYLHFPDKLAVIRALCDRDFLTLAKQFQKIAKVADPIERLRQVGRAYTVFALSHPNHYQLMFMTPLKGVNKAAESDVERGNPKSTPTLPEVDRDRCDRLRSPASRVQGRGRAGADVLGGRARRRVALHREVRRRLGRMAAGEEDRGGAHRRHAPRPAP